MTRVGYARVSTPDQDPALQIDALTGAGCNRIFKEHASGARTDRPGLAEALGYLRDGDVLVVWKLDRLGRSLPHLIETVTALERKGVGFLSLTEAIDTTTPGGRLIFHMFGALGEFEAFRAHNEHFHDAIYRGSGNEFLETTTRGVRRRLAPFRKMQFELRRRPEGSQVEHGRIVDAIIGGDGDRAAAAMRDHILIVRDKVDEVVLPPQPAEALPVAQ